MLTIGLPAGAEAILAELATSAGQSKEEFARKALLRQMEVYEDTIAAGKALDEFYASGEKTIPLAQVVKDLGLEDLNSPMLPKGSWPGWISQSQSGLQAF